MPEPTPQPRPEPNQPRTMDPTELAALNEALEAARYAMANRNLEDALVQIELAKLLASGTSRESEVNRVGMLHDNLKQFFKAVTEGSKGLTALQEIQIGQKNPRIAVVIEATPERLVIKDQGVIRRFNLGDTMPAALCELLARRWFKGDEATNDVFVGTFHAVDAQGDKERARQLWNSARNTGSGTVKTMVNLIMPELDR